MISFMLILFILVRMARYGNIHIAVLNIQMTMYLILVLLMRLKTLGVGMK